MHTLDTAPEQNIRPTVTVIVPCHNHADMVGEAIDSVIKQDYRPINIAVVDDGSKDNPEPVIRQKIESGDIFKNASGGAEEGGCS